jgi:hypothetical protein
MHKYKTDIAKLRLSFASSLSSSANSSIIKAILLIVAINLERPKIKEENEMSIQLTTGVEIIDLEIRKMTQKGVKRFVEG